MKQITKKEIVIDAYIAFAMFVGNNDHKSLVVKLELIEKQLKKGKNTDKTLWFRFFKGDTAATDINNIKYSFDRKDQNREYYFENICQCVFDQSLEIYFS